MESIDIAIIQYIKTNNADFYELIRGKVEKSVTPVVNVKEEKVYITKFRRVSLHTTEKALFEFEDMGIDKLMDLFSERCRYYSITRGFVSQWLYIPEIMHVIASLYYGGVKSKRQLNLNEMKEQFKQAKINHEKISKENDGSDNGSDNVEKVKRKYVKKERAMCEFLDDD